MIFGSAARLLTPHERRRIDFVAYGEALRGYPKDLHSVERHINLLDPVPMLLGGSIDHALFDSFIKGHDVNYHLYVHDWLHPIVGYIKEDIEHEQRQKRKRLLPSPAQEAPLTWIERHR